MAKSRSNKHWRRQQTDDPYLRRAQAEGWRSRAVFKLMEIQQREGLLRRGQSLVDLGAAPGGWSQYAASMLGPDGRVLAIDTQAMDPIAGVEFIRGDFSADSVLEKLLEMTGESATALVLSDMSPNITGNRSVDQPRAMYLAELALDFARRALKPGGHFICKLFQGEGFDDYVRDCRGSFVKVKARKPAASRPESRETYLVARTYRM